MTFQPGHYIQGEHHKLINRVLRVFPTGTLDVRDTMSGRLKHITRPEHFHILRGEPMKIKLSLADARIQAQDLIQTLAPFCARLNIAGSIRRQRPHVGDIELVAIPLYDPLIDLFNQVYGQQSRLDLALDDLVATGRLQPGDKQGPRYKKFILPRYRLHVDLFITDPDSWGVIYTQRTGSADFVHWLVTPQAKGGALPGTMRVRDRRVWRHGGRLSTPDEQDVFNEIGVPWLAPRRREKELWKK